VGSYYFLASTLPSPVFGQKPSLGSGEFLGICGRSLSRADFAALALADAAPGSDDARKAGGLVGEYLFRELILRNELARLRGLRLDKDSAPYLRAPYRPFLDPEPLQAAQRSFQAGNPLQGEVELSRSLWNWLDGRIHGRVFDFDALSAYYLKLRVLERLGLFEEERGAGEYDAVYAAVLARANGVTA
jgi:hypothetical protein